MKNISFEYFYTFSHPRDSAVTPHGHPCFELVYYLRGKGSSRAGEADFFYEAGDILLYPPGVEHNEIHAEDTSVICIAFGGEDPGLLAAPCRFTDEDGAVLELVQKIRSEIRLHRFQFRQMAEAYIAQLLVVLGRLGECGRENEDCLSFVPRIIAENLMFDIDLQALADQSGYSYHRFRHLFKERFGTSPKQYILDCRVAAAKKMLREGKMSVSDVAFACGFASFSAFSQIFKQHVGVSPSAYMRG